MALEASEHKCRDLVENISEVIYACDKHVTITYIGPAINAFIGHSPAEVS
jgi:hypothetical protein